MGYAWIPDAYTTEDVEAGTIKYLPVDIGAEREVAVYMTFADKEFAGPATKRLAEILKECLPKSCAGHQE